MRTLVVALLLTLSGSVAVCASDAGPPSPAEIRIEAAQRVLREAAEPVPGL